MRIKTCIAPALFLGATFLGCAEEPVPFSAPRTVPSAVSVAQPAEDIRSADTYRQLAVRIEASMNAGDASVFMGAFDVDALLDRILAELGLSDEQRMECAPSITSAPRIVLSTSRAIAKGGSFRLLRIHTVDGEQRALFRQISGGGASYQDVIFARGKDGTAKIVDIYLFRAGENYSKIIRREVLRALAEESKSFLGGLLGYESDYVASRAGIKKMQALARRKRHKEALALCLGLPASLQKDRSILMQRVAYAKRVDAVAYNAAVTAYKMWHPDSPALPQMMIDYHFHRKEFDEALACIDALDKAVGGDPYLDFMRACHHFAAGRLVETKAATLRAIKVEPTQAMPHWLLVRLALEAKEFSEVPSLLTTLEEQCGQKINPKKMRTGSFFAEFVKSPEYAKWLAARKAPPAERDTITP